MLNPIGMHDALVTIGLSVATRHAGAIHRADVLFMLLMIGFIITGSWQIFFAGSHTQGDGYEHQAVDQKCFHVLRF